MALFVILQRYGDPDAVERLHAEHVAWIEDHAANGTFLLAGQSEPSGGSVILADARSREHLAALVEEDAFFRHGVVTSTEIVEFRPRRGSLRRNAHNPLYATSAS